MKKGCLMVLRILLLPLVVLALLGLVLYTPVDCLRYKRSRYYKDTRERYSWLAGGSCYVKLYGLIKRETLPIEYHRYTHSAATAHGCFLYGDTLILNDYEPCYDAEQDVWTIEVDDEYVDIRGDVDGEITRCNEFLGTERCQKALVLIDRDVWEEHPEAHYERIEFLPVDGDWDAEAIKMWITSKSDKE